VVAEAGADALEGDWDVVVLTNPNNPDGRLTAPGRIVKAAGRMAARGGWVVVDEAFADVAPEHSVAAHVEMTGLIVLRSFGKFFGLAGLRLGFALAAPALAADIRTALGPWPFSRPAGAVAIEAFGDAAWIAATGARLADAAQRLDRVLISSGFTVPGGTALFRLAEHADANHIFRHLAGAGILARHFPDRPDRLRFGLPGADEAVERLQAALAPWRRTTAP
jgi:cobalamin biosynthetic protein CobC